MVNSNTNPLDGLSEVFKIGTEFEKDVITEAKPVIHEITRLGGNPNLEDVPRYDYGLKFPLAKSQKDVLNSIISIIDEDKDSFIKSRVGVQGSAGVGKTVLILTLVIHYLSIGYKPSEIVICTPTGKASGKLISLFEEYMIKSVVSKTIHSSVLKLADDLEDGDLLEFMVREYGELEDKPKIVLCDEASMVSDLITHLMENLDSTIIFFGDILQLPPVEGNYNRYMLKPTLTLTEIFRQDSNSSIITLAYDVANDGRGNPLFKDCAYLDLDTPIPMGYRPGNKSKINILTSKIEDLYNSGRYNTSQITLTSENFKDKRDKGRVTIPNLINYLRDTWDTQIICGKNVDRNFLNRECREALGLCPLDTDSLAFKNRKMLIGQDPRYPQVGDKIICSKNIKVNNLNGVAMGTAYNGDFGIIHRIISINPLSDNMIADIYWYRKNCIIHSLNMSLSSFFMNATTGIKEQTLNTKWEYGYVISCHKAQGSEYLRTVVYTDWCGCWPTKDKYGNIIMDDNIRKWYYTAFTRAKEHLTIVKSCGPMNNPKSKDSEDYIKPPYRPSIPVEIMPFITELERKLRKVERAKSNKNKRWTNIDEVTIDKPRDEFTIVVNTDDVFL